MRSLKRTIECSIDDGSALDFKSAELLKKYDLPATFFVPLSTELTWEAIQELGEDFEIGGHTISHPQDLKALEFSEMREEIEGGKHRLEAILGRTITKFCYPRGRYNEQVIHFVKKAGFKEARTTRVLEINVVCPFRKATTIHVFNGRKEYQGKGWEHWAYKLWKLEPPYFHIFWHSWEVERDGQWEALEKFLKHVKQERKT